MKHIVGLTQSRPHSADAFQNVICEFNQTFNSILGAKGGSLPGKDFVVDKCDFSRGGGSEEGTTE